MGSARRAVGSCGLLQYFQNAQSPEPSPVPTLSPSGTNATEVGPACVRDLVSVHIDTVLGPSGLCVAYCKGFIVLLLASALAARLVSTAAWHVAASGVGHAYSQQLATLNQQQPPS